MTRLDVRSCVDREDGPGLRDKLLRECELVDRMTLRDFKIAMILLAVNACYEACRSSFGQAAVSVLFLCLAACGHRSVKRDLDEMAVRDVMEG